MIRFEIYLNPQQHKVIRIILYIVGKSPEPLNISILDLFKIKIITSPYHLHDEECKNS